MIEGNRDRNVICTPQVSVEKWTLIVCDNDVVEIPREATVDPAVPEIVPTSARKGPFRANSSQVARTRK